MKAKFPIKLSLSISFNTYRQLVKLKKKHGGSMAELIRIAINYYLSVQEI
jgi:predicted CopG family antitoxin